VALGVIVFGYLLAWWRDWLGGFISLAAFVAFYGWAFWSSGRLLGGPEFPLCFAGVAVSFGDVVAAREPR